MGKRLPTILGKAIDDTMKTLNEEHEEGKITDLLRCIERMTQLMDDLHSNATLRVIKDDGEGDVALWNKEIARFFKGEHQQGKGYCASIHIPRAMVLTHWLHLTLTHHRQELHERPLALRRGLQVPPSS